MGWDDWVEIGESVKRKELMSCGGGGDQKKQSDAMEENEPTKIADCNDVKQAIAHPKGVG